MGVGTGAGGGASSAGMTGAAAVVGGVLLVLVAKKVMAAPATIPATTAAIARCRRGTRRIHMREVMKRLRIRLTSPSGTPGDEEMRVFVSGASVSRPSGAASDGSISARLTR